MKKTLLLVLVLLFGLPENGKSQEISRFQGFMTYHHYEDSNKISKRDFENLLKTDDITYAYWKKSIMYENIAALGTSAGIILILMGANANNDISNRALFSWSGLGAVLGGIALQITSNKMERKAILRYNDQVSIGSLGFGPTPNGFGLALSF